MARRIDVETQLAILEAYHSGGVSYKTVAEQFGVAVNTVMNIVNGNKLKNGIDMLKANHKHAEVMERKDPAAPPRDCIEAFTPLYQRIIELNRQKAEINKELSNIKATLRNALNIAEDGSVPK